MELTSDRCEVECIHPEDVAPLLGNVVARPEADELCACDLALLLGRSESALSHQLRLAGGLRHAREDAPQREREAS